MVLTIAFVMQLTSVQLKVFAFSQIEIATSETSASSFTMLKSYCLYVT